MIQNELFLNDYTYTHTKTNTQTQVILISNKITYRIDNLFKEEFKPLSKC